MSRCLKQIVTCVITDETNGVSVEGTNRCTYPLGTEECPRVVAGMRSGEGYEMCGPQHHAEVVAIRCAKEKGMDVRRGTARIYGHTYVCLECREALHKAGINRVLIRGKEI